MIGALITFIVGIPVSYMTDRVKSSKKLLSPLVHFLVPDEGNADETYFNIEEALVRVQHSNEFRVDKS